MSQFTPTGTFLDRILTRKAEEIRERRKFVTMEELKAFVTEVAPHDAPRDFVAALRQPNRVALIAEVKKASPSKGVLIEDFDPVRLGTSYAANGAAAISVLTDRPFFQGDLQYLFSVRAEVGVPVLCKDFIIDPYQIYSARAAGADAALLIVAALPDAHLRDLYGLIVEMGMVPLVEVHNEAEIERALSIDATVIGINNRDLKTFDVNLATTERLAKIVPEDVTLVAESGIRHAADVRRMGELGAHAVLVGETLVLSNDIPATVRLLANQPREVKA